MAGDFKITGQVDTVSPEINLRPPSEVMQLARLGLSFQTRISFMRQLIRRMNCEGWRIRQEQFALDDDGYGQALYIVSTPTRDYSLVCFSHYLEPTRRTDRVIAEAWDATFSLFDGEPGSSDISRLENQTPRQEAGRFQASELVMSRANKSLRLFDRVVNSLAFGTQPDVDAINDIGYLMRTTAVYANGKFGMADRARYADRPELAPPYQAEMLAVYMIRRFSLDLVEHVARRKNPNRYVPLDRHLKRHIGIGNATGLGMAPFLVSHPTLIHKWFHARETALAKIRSLEAPASNQLKHFQKLIKQAAVHVAEWKIEDEKHRARVAALKNDLQLLTEWTSKESKFQEARRPWDALYTMAEGTVCIEAQELLVSLILEPYPEHTDKLGNSLHVDREMAFDPKMSVAEFCAIVDQYYSWALDVDFSNPRQSKYFWYYSDEKIEPRRGVRREEAGVEKEMQIAIARDVQSLRDALKTAKYTENMAIFLLRSPELRHIVKRVLIGAQNEYSEIQDNIIADTCRPIDILRCKLAFFGATKFDPKSDLWTRVTMYQGAPLDDELDRDDTDNWGFPVKPVGKLCKSH